MMTKIQWLVMGGGLLLFLILYFLFDTKPKGRVSLEKSRVLAAESTTLEVLLPEAKAVLNATQSSAILALEQQLTTTTEENARLSILKRLSGKWYEFGQPAIAGGYAQEVAEIANTDTAWSIAGTTFAICMQTVSETKVKNFCANRAIAAFEKAISLAPEHIPHRVNLALCYSENPPPGEGMKGPSMLLELNRQYPENVLILNSLARLAIKTGQYDKAKERLEKAYTLERANLNTICLLAQVYEALQDIPRAEMFARECSKLQDQR